MSHNVPPYGIFATVRGEHEFGIKVRHYYSATILASGNSRMARSQIDTDARAFFELRHFSHPHE
jgi:hypothetical protein